MSRQDGARLGDIVVAVEAIRDHLTRGDFHDGLVYDAVRVRLRRAAAKPGSRYLTWHREQVVQEA